VVAAIVRDDHGINRIGVDARRRQIGKKLTVDFGQKSPARIEAIVPLYAPGQNSKYEKYFQTSITARNLHLLEKAVKSILQGGGVDPAVILHGEWVFCVF